MHNRAIAFLLYTLTLKTHTSTHTNTHSHACGKWPKAICIHIYYVSLDQTDLLVCNTSKFHSTSALLSVLWLKKATSLQANKSLLSFNPQILLSTLCTATPCKKYSASQCNLLPRPTFLGARNKSKKASKEASKKASNEAPLMFGGTL